MALRKLSLEEQMKFAKSEDEDIRIELASFELSPEVADFLIRNEKDNIVLWKIMIRLFNRPDSNIWPSTLKFAARQKRRLGKYYEDPLSCIALHLNTDVKTLKYLYRLNNHHIHWALAENPNTPQKKLNKLAKKKHESIDHALLHNPNTPEKTKKGITCSGFFPCGSYYETYKIEIKASGN